MADSLGIAQGSLSKLEMGIAAVSEDLIAQLAATLDYPTRFFFLEGRITGVGVAEMFHRKRQSVPARTLRKIYAQIEICIKHVATLSKAKEVPCLVPRHDIDEYEGDAEQVAGLVRAAWNLPRGPIDDLTRIVERAGIVVIPLYFGTRYVDAISKWVPGLPPLFFVNTESPKDRLRFSLAHELGHMVMHDLPNAGIEEQANTFAAEFLLPARDIMADLIDLTLPKLAQLKRYWKTSMAAILMRADALKTLTPNQVRYLWQQFSRLGYRSREPASLDVQGENARLLFSLLDVYSHDLGYSDEELADLLALHPREMCELYRRGGDAPPYLTVVRP